MGWSLRPSMPAGGRVKAEALDAILDQIELNSSLECVLSNQHAGVTSSTTLVNTNLVRAVKANTTYRVVCRLYYSASTAGDIKFDIGKPSGASLLRGTLMSLPSSTDTSSGDTYFGTDNTSLANMSAPGQTTASTVVTCILDAIISIGATAGNLTLQYAQATSNGTATILRSSSSMHVYAVDMV